MYWRESRVARRAPTIPWYAPHRCLVVILGLRSGAQLIVPPKPLPPSLNTHISFPTLCSCLHLAPPGISATYTQLPFEDKLRLIDFFGAFLKLAYVLMSLSSPTNSSLCHVDLSRRHSTTTMDDYCPSFSQLKNSIRPLPRH